MKLPVDDEGRLSLDIEDLETIERPPLLTIPAYKEMRALLEQGRDDPEISESFSEKGWVPN